MPKIIENLKDRLMTEARWQIDQNGYAAVTIRSIATACGVGVGTVYNYFPSKESLIATYLLEDWNKCIATIQIEADRSELPGPVLLCIYEQLTGFACHHEAIFRDNAAAAGFSGSFSQYHALLRNQLAKPLRKFCENDFIAEFIAESLLTWSMAGKSFDDIYGVIEKII